MAGAGYKLFNTGDVLTAQQVNEYLMQQTIMVFADAAARTTALSGVLAEGMLSYLKSTDATEVYNGSAWVALAADQTPLTTKGDLFTYTTADARLASSNVNGDVLTVDTSTASGLKWAAPAASGAYTQLATGTLSSTSVVISSISGSYRNLVLVILNPFVNTGTLLGIRINGSTSATHQGVVFNSNATANSLTNLGGGTGTYWDLTSTANLSTTSQTMNSFICTFPEYATANPYKTMTTNGYFENVGNAVIGNYTQKSVTAAITSITIMTGNGTSTFSGGSYTLYGVK